ncbi:hypothetical protein BKA65DRAFT_65070 [Rhexocercosporidium sp. MPI-PUGE-AT-0058]|nr:hypothetical protein BKA65DRAFT_65070 [Rhexocercosporidium sp. MPI-PUGE-AT-0058]
MLVNKYSRNLALSSLPFTALVSTNLFAQKYYNQLLAMAQPVELEANTTTLNVENTSVELEVPFQSTHTLTGALQEPFNTDVADLVPPPHPWRETKNKIIRLERETVEAHTLPDNSTYRSYLAANWKTVFSEGVVSGTGYLSDWQRWRSPTMSEISVLRIGENVAIVYYKLKVEPYQQPGWPMKQFRSSTWRKEDGEEWKMVFHQCTPRK